MAIVLSLLIALASGFLYGICFPPVAARWLAWIALVPLFVAMRRASMSRALVLAAIFAGTGACATIGWLPRTVAVYFHQPLWVGVALSFGVTLLMVVPWYVAFAGCYKLFSIRPGAALPLLAGAAWVSGEFARSHLLTGNPWVLFGYSQVGVDHVLQVADLIGVYGVSFVLVVVTSASAELWISWWRTGRIDPGSLGGAAVAACVLALALGYGHVRLSQFPTAGSRTDVAVVQGNLDLGSQWRPDLYGRNLDTYLRLTLDILRARSVPLIVWPENAMTFFLETEPVYQAVIARVLRPFGAQLVAGGPATWDATDPKFSNSAFVISPQGAVLARYDKERLLPLAEYFPFSSFDLLRRDFGRLRQFTPGRSAAPLPTAIGPAGVLICNEALFPEFARARVRDRAAYLVVLSNDSWVDSQQYALITSDMSSVRAVEQRRYLVRASTSGPSAIVDPLGRLVVATGRSTSATVVGSIAPSTELTVYARLGDAFAVACVVLTTAALVVGLVSPRVISVGTAPPERAVRRPPIL
jgi:apolipoprotein N-acyltransferase